MPSQDFLDLNPGYQPKGAARYSAAKPLTADGYRFDSQAEYDRYKELLLSQAAGAISDVQVHPLYELQAAFTAGGKHYRAISYEGDFAYTERGRVVVEDVKGARTEIFRLKEKLFRCKYPAIDFRVLDV